METVSLILDFVILGLVVVMSIIMHEQKQEIEKLKENKD